MKFTNVRHDQFKWQKLIPACPKQEKWKNPWKIASIYHPYTCKLQSCHTSPRIRVWWQIVWKQWQKAVVHRWLSRLACMMWYQWFKPHKNSHIQHLLSRWRGVGGMVFLRYTLLGTILKKWNLTGHRRSTRYVFITHDWSILPTTESWKVFWKYWMMVISIAKVNSVVGNIDQSCIIKSLIWSPISSKISFLPGLCH